MEKTNYTKSELKSEFLRKEQLRFLEIQYGIKFTSGKCICPFHEENVPSFSYYTDKDKHIRFRCFGCNVNEDIFGIMRRKEPWLSFGDALSLFLRYVTQGTHGGYNDIL